MEVTDHFITSQFSGKVADTVTGNNIAQVSIRKLYGWGVKETTIVSLKILPFFAAEVRH